MSHKIIGRYIKNINFAIPDPQTFFEMTDNIGISVISLLFIGVTLMIDPAYILVSYSLPKSSITLFVTSGIESLPPHGDG